jgi:hypothetical protein
VIGRRVATVEEVTEPGDYCGPITGYTGDRPAVFFRLPIQDAAGSRAALRHVSSPPHQFRECTDGSLEIRASIGAIAWAHESEYKEGRYVWHGYLDEGHVWRTV